MLRAILVLINEADMICWLFFLCEGHCFLLLSARYSQKSSTNEEEAPDGGARGFLGF
jgi:hypothetical protein